ncbi:potassium channel family protein [Sphingomonas sp. BN140010]|uniref:Potassium channel family protein n=1 Tax=Sphingomonas arvum TaxID=2992113 RepID=A0ABT3JHE7_9SPHN|nr:potassium channel family protein [Sphingomonas sp. BN140010]MCW3798478.1 potassium channel family protein [Sphingomonas sp. BN140010]
MTLQQFAGAGLLLLFLADIFLTVLYARAGTGLLAPYWNRAVWALVRAVARPFGRRQSKVLSFGGPLIVVSLIAFWSLGLTIGAALLIQPELGTSIKPSSGDTPTDFVTAMLVAGNSLSIVGGGDYSPQTTGTRLLYLFNSLVGASVLSLVLSYLVQVYSALRERNALALAIDVMTARTGNAAEMLARLGPDGDFNDATSSLDNLVRSLSQVKEAHHFYPLLFYFRFVDPRYSVSRFSFVLLDLTTLIDTALGSERYRSLQRSAAVVAVRECAQMLIETLDRNFPTANEGPKTVADRAEESFTLATERLRQEGAEVLGDPRAYVALRSGWEPVIRRVAPSLGYRTEEIDRRVPPPGD